ncbi:hypothetical protein [Oryzobacter telluris]|uniref:hypothetical protein n=1 Tax=Oryzobacter telluris TaxID=3149179 RepID=UPI00370D5E16
MTPFRLAIAALVTVAASLLAWSTPTTLGSSAALLTLVVLVASAITLVAVAIEASMQARVATSLGCGLAVAATGLAAVALAPHPLGF